MRRHCPALTLVLFVALACLAGCQDDDATDHALLAMVFTPASGEPTFDGTDYIWEFTVTIAELRGVSVQLDRLDWVSYLEDDSILFTDSYDCATLAANFAMSDCYLPGHGSYSAADALMWPFSDTQRLVGTVYGVDEEGRPVEASAQFIAEPPAP